PRFSNRRLHLPCIAFPVTAVKRSRSQDQTTRLAYCVKADGLDNLLVTTEDKLTQFSPARPTRQTFLIIRPWNRHDLGVPDFMRALKLVVRLGQPFGGLLLAQQRGGEHKRIAADNHIIARVKDMTAV
ncbi:hypothetical protein CY34DRAFT_37252, partial [Suillus luteus UH-Slu-Lm8-n1]